MRATRGLLASLGAGLSLILAASVALTFVSALVAFHGWPGVREQPGADERALVADVAARQRTAPAAAPVRLPLPQPLARPRPVRPVATAVRPGERIPAVRAVATALRAAPGRGTVARPATGAGVPVTAAPAPAPAPAPAKGATPVTAPAAETVRKLGQTLDATVDTTGAAVGEVLAPVLPPVASAVTNATDAVGDLLDRVTGVVGVIVDNLGRPAG